jgi:hypothetical protein
LVAKQSTGAVGGRIKNTGSCKVAGCIAEVDVAFNIIEIAVLRRELATVVEGTDWLGWVDRCSGSRRCSNGGRN